MVIVALPSVDHPLRFVASGPTSHKLVSLASQARRPEPQIRRRSGEADGVPLLEAGSARAQDESYQRAAWGQLGWDTRVQHLRTHITH